MTPEEANAILAKRFGMQQPVVAQPGMYVRRTQSQPSILNPPQLSKAEQLMQAARERLGNAGAAARMKMREQEEQGVRSYAPANPEAANVELTKRMLVPNLPMPSATPTPTELRQRPTGGVVASYGPNERVVTGNRGAGTAVIPTGPRKPATFDGMSREQFFGQAAARQGEDNKYARAEKAVLEAMKQGGAKGKEKKD
jgi:hypothetical protein